MTGGVVTVSAKALLLVQSPLVLQLTCNTNCHVWTVAVTTVITAHTLKITPMASADAENTVELELLQFRVLLWSNS